MALDQWALHEVGKFYAFIIRHICDLSVHLVITGDNDGHIFTLEHLQRYHYRANSALLHLILILMTIKLQFFITRWMHCKTTQPAQTLTSLLCWLAT